MPSMYPGSAGVGPGSSGGGPGVPGGGGGVGGGAPHPHAPHPASGMGPGGVPTSKSSVMNTMQLQQLSAQLKAYKLLARNVSPPDALISIVHGRKPTAAMLAALGKQPPTHQQSSHQSLGAPPQGGQSGSGATEGGSGGNISLYPLSPSVSQGASPASSTPSQAPMRSTSSLSQSLSSSGGAPNVTISTSGELPLSVKQAMSAAQTRSSNTPPSGQQQPGSAPTSVSPATSTQGPSTSVSGQTGLSGSQMTAAQQQQSSSQQQQAAKAQVKAVKLAPSSKPQGIDPSVIIKEREHR